MVEFKAQHLAQFFDQLYPKLDLFAERLFSEQPGLRPFSSFTLMRAFLGLIFSYLMTEWMFGKFLPQHAAAGDLDAFVTIYLHGILSSTSNGAVEC